MNALAKKMLSSKGILNQISLAVEISNAKIFITGNDQSVLFANCKNSEASFNVYDVIYNNSPVCKIFHGADSEKTAELINHLMMDYLNRKKLTNETLEKYHELNIIYTLNERLAYCIDMHAAANTIVEEANKSLKFDYACILLKGDDEKNGIILNSFLFPQNTGSIKEIMMLEKITYISCKAEIVNEPATDARFENKLTFTKSFMFSPLIVKSRTIGAIITGNYNNCEYKSKDLKLLTAIAAIASPSIENIKLYEESRDSFGQIIHSLIEAVDKLERDSEGHSSRVAEYAVKIGQVLNLASNQIIILKLAALLHDIGKIGLAKEEYEAHPSNSCLILRHIKKFGDILPAVKHHHEYINGTGFPDHISGENIPLFARIIAVANNFDILKSKYHCTTQDALERIKSRSGKHFDTTVVQALFKFCSCEYNKF